MFGHAIVRQTLADEWGRNPSRAARLHRAAAEALERAYAASPAGRAAHAAELATQYHASRALPGAAGGVPHALVAAEQARAAVAPERAVAFLRIARDLAADLDPAERGDVLARLATTEAEALLLDEAAGTAEAALAALREGNAPPASVAAFLACVAAALKLAGADGAVWQRLVGQGLALVGEEHGLPWARLTLLRDPVAPIPSDTLRAARWLGFAPEAVRVARLLGDEEDHARTFDSFDARTREETRDLLALARTWTRPTERRSSPSSALGSCSRGTTSRPFRPRAVGGPDPWSDAGEYGDYELWPPEDDPDARELRGSMSVDDEGGYPFVLRALDAGGPGEGRDTIVLTVGPEAAAGTPSAATPAGDFAYEVEATVSAGDLQLLSFDEPGQG